MFLNTKIITKRDKNVLRFIENHKAITVKQAEKIFYKNNEVSRRRLKYMEENNVLKSYDYKVNRKERAYYSQKKLSSHDLLVLDFYSELIASGSKILNFIKQPRYLNDLIRPDALIQFEYKSNIYLQLIEVDLTHYTSNDKMQLYEKLYKEGELQKEFNGVFPDLIVLRKTITTKYLSKNFYVGYLNFRLDNFKLEVLDE